jgi:hypothetical protein
MTIQDSIVAVKNAKQRGKSGYPLCLNASIEACYFAAKAAILFDMLWYSREYFSRKGKEGQSQGTYKLKNAN